MLTFWLRKQIHNEQMKQINKRLKMQRWTFLTRNEKYILLSFRWMRPNEPFSKDSVSKLIVHMLQHHQRCIIEQYFFFISFLWRAFHLCSLFMFRRVSLSFLFHWTYARNHQTHWTTTKYITIRSTEQRAIEAHRIESRIECLLNEFIVLHMKKNRAFC